jgi:hypothetical protein
MPKVQRTLARTADHADRTAVSVAWSAWSATQTNVAPTTKVGRRQGSVFIVRLQARPGIDPIRALRAALKALGRRYGLRCVEVSEETTPWKPPERPAEAIVAPVRSQCTSGGQLGISRRKKLRAQRPGSVDK